jgi:hypothetical protein
MGKPRIGYRQPMSLRRESPIRGRRLRLDEALMERALMSPAGYRFLVHVAPRIDKMVIPRTSGRLSSVGIDRVGLVTTTGAKSGLPRTHPLVLLDDSDGLIAIGPTMVARHTRRGAATCWPTPNARSSSWLRPRNTEPSC